MSKVEEIIKSGVYFFPDAGVIKSDAFSKIYPIVNKYLYEQKEFMPSRDGNVKELLNVKTELTNPYRRCVGGYGRNINVFFLMAEAIWIALGRKDVEFLTIFNKNMAKYSDNGKSFHAPYGFRLRHWGVQSEIEFQASGGEKSSGYDQVINAIRLLSENPNTRQVVMSIWNPDYDLGFITKDIPCNDMVMFKIRNGKLVTTIANRSNDLHLGLPTNIFQFSFLTELIAGCLGIELGTQTHNSQSLHLYEWNESAKEMYDNYEAGVRNELYEGGASELHIDFNFQSEIATNRFRELECVLQMIVDNLIRIENGDEPDEEEESVIMSFSKYLFYEYKLLCYYILYKRRMAGLNDEHQKNLLRTMTINYIESIEQDMNSVMNNGDSFKWDIGELAKNFFYRRITEGKENYVSL